jgi:cytoskeleton protein RodZ
MTETVGERLRQARLSKEKSLEDASRVTRIKLKYLEALESDQLDLIPSMVQARGFLRMYCDYLGVPSQYLLNLLAGLPEESPPPPIAEATPITFDENLTEEPNLSSDDKVDTEQAEEVAQTSNEIFKTLGSRLRHQRQSLNLSLENVENLSHIRQNYLSALENGDLDKLPSTVQGRGMLLNYAGALHLNEDEMLSLFATGLQLRLQETQQRLHPHKKFSLPKQPVKPQNRTGLRRLLSLDMIAVLLVILVLFAFAVWSAAETSSAIASETSGTITAVARLTLGTSTITPSVTPTPEKQTTLSDTPSGNVTPILTGTFPVIENRPVQVLVIAHQRAWMRVTVDNVISFEGRVVPGNAYPFAGSEKVELLTGNAAALQVFYNSQDIGSLGLMGQVVNLIFTPNEAITPTPRFSPTITPTITVTPTLQPATATPTFTETIIIP